ncbi:NYN_YacP domain-containing protein [Gossypium australe]|uniref:NYN_YacP domain-containing protein n=1 Tax=Gossypium australe TaxID=47621 RepID=A0A5B6WEB5_9ROSI|nr:NYN_YacP domain-containing protein [Gossypium australe]
MRIISLSLHYCCSDSASYKGLAVILNKSSSPSPHKGKGPESAPPRITSNVKQNLQFLKLWKEFQKSKSSAPKPATSYRRKKVQKEELPEDIELYRVKVVVVFDAMMSGLPTHKETFAGIDIVYSGESCADAWIEKEVVALREDGCPKVWVVTSDHCQQHAAHGAGAFIWSSKALVSEIKASQKEVERMLQEQRSTSFQGKLLKHNLDTEVVDALKDLRRQLSENESC